MTKIQTISVHSNQVNPLRNKGGNIRVTISPKTVASTQLIMGQLLLEAGETLIEHIHDYGEEAFYVISGTGNAYIEDEEIVLTPHISVIVPQGCRHRIVNTGMDSLMLIFATAPLAPTAASGDRVTTM